MESSVLAVSIPEAARQLSVCTRTVTYLINSNELASRKIGRRRVIPQSALNAFIRRDHPTPARTKKPEGNATIN